MSKKKEIIDLGGRGEGRVWTPDQTSRDIDFPSFLLGGRGGGSDQVGQRFPFF